MQSCRKVKNFGGVSKVGGADSAGSGMTDKVFGPIKNGVKSRETAGYNGARTVYNFNLAICSSYLEFFDISLQPRICKIKTIFSHSRSEQFSK